MCRCWCSGKGFRQAGFPRFSKSISLSTPALQVTNSAVAAAKAKSTEVYGLVSKDLGEVGNQVGSAAGSVGQQVGSAAGAVKKTLEVNGGTHS